MDLRTPAPLGWKERKKRLRNAKRAAGVKGREERLGRAERAVGVSRKRRKEQARRASGPLGERREGEGKGERKVTF